MSRSNVEPCCLATTLGSLPHTDVARGTALVLRHTPAIPSWVQFPRRCVEEKMVVQFTEGMPGLRRDGDRFFFDTAAPAFVDELTEFYGRYLAATEGEDPAALDGFGLSPAYAAGLAELLRQWPAHPGRQATIMVKGQVTGPFTLGTNLVDQNRRCAYYDDRLRDVVVKTLAMRAAWQVERLGALGLPVLIFLDEPSLLGFGSQTFLTVSREDVMRDLNEVAAAIHERGALAGVHCEENTDWSLLMATDLDILSFDAYDHMQAITLYPAELHAFLARGGWLAWGLVPTLDREAAARETVSSLQARFEAGIGQLAARGFSPDLLRRRALLTPSCGAGGVLTEPLAERVLGLLQELSAAVRGT